ncbi:MAG: hypothetical protein NVSMB14_15920 [Isosphaeraceae bacterium]
MMETSTIVALSREAIRMALILGGPALCAALLVALAVGIVQTMTQLHDPVIGQVPRLAVILIFLLAVLPWMIGVWVSYASELFRMIPEWI